MLHLSPIDSGAPAGEEDPLDEQLRRLARSPLTPVLLVGPEGGERVRVAARLHELTYPRRRAPFINVDCAWLRADEAGGRLFGHDARGARGAVESAARGTLFLDNVADLPPPDQARLADLLDRMRFRRLGGRREIAVQLRLTAATREDGRELVRRGRLRADLWGHLSVFPITLPAFAG